VREVWETRRSELHMAIYLLLKEEKYDKTRSNKEK
jgi:hypothetical protein